MTLTLKIMLVAKTSAVSSWQMSACNTEGSSAKIVLVCSSAQAESFNETKEFVEYLNVDLSIVKNV